MVLNYNITDIKYQENILSILRKLEKASKISEKHGNIETQAYILYFLGYLYYKAKDYFTAKEKLEECIKLKSKFLFKQPACYLLENIWNIKIQPNLIDWWLYSPLNYGLNRYIFVIISLIITALSTLFFYSLFVHIWFSNLQINWSLL